jgi:thioredoxin-related protein
MRKAIVISLFTAFFALAVNAQTAVKKVYNEDINPIEQIDQAVAKAKSEGKFVICQVGGNWCPWCLRFADFITKDATISNVIDESFVYIHVNYNPRKSEGEKKVQLAKAMLKCLNNPARFGFPVFVVLDEEGRVIHIQDSSFLEEGQGYSQEKVLRFFKNWTPKAVKQ